MYSILLIALSAVATAQVSPPPIPGSPQMILNGNFTNDTYGWQSSPVGTITNGQYCIHVPASSTLNNSTYLRTTYKFLETKNDVYPLDFTASSSAGYDILVQTPDPPLDPNLNMIAALTTTSYSSSMTFSPANQAPNATLEFDLGAAPAGAVVCIGAVSMKRIDRSAWWQNYGPAIKINQLGYLPSGPKVASFVTNSTASIAWTLHDTNGDACASGQPTYRGSDAASNQTVSIVDFSSFTTEGSGYTLSVGGSVSYPFSISSTLYGPLRQDSLCFFYQQRGGIAVDGNLIGPQYARAAGHIQIPPNKGDKIVPCQAVHDSLIAYLEPWTCNYTLDVAQGWYDAGDQGKYVVNGGISAAQLFMGYERSVYRNASSTKFGDGSLRIPERDNGIPDVLDEARWALDFLIKMQVPANSAPQLFNGSMIDMSGMAHHKMHDNEWTPLPTDPSQAPKRRELHRPSTAATLNLAAAAAMGARVFQNFDPVYAATALNVAQVAYAAAKRHPAILAPGTDWDLGGGAYSDDDVSDEFYWAAAEMYLTTGGSEYLGDLQQNPYHTANVSATFQIPSGFSWGSVAPLARLDLATISSNISNHANIVQSVVEAAEMLLEVQSNTSNGFGVFLVNYPWGSNSNNLNHIQVSQAKSDETIKLTSAQIVATSADLTGNTTYRSAALEGIDYVLGRNAISQSYIREYGTKDTQNVHSRLYAYELSDQVPQAPAGAMGGGANQAASDPPADDVLQGYAPQTCYLDDVNSYSTNDVAINWASVLSETLKQDRLMFGFRTLRSLG